MSTRGTLGAAEFASCLQFHMKWTEGLHGAGPLREALADLSGIFGARVVHLHRFWPATGRQRTIASVDHGAAEGERPLTVALGPRLLSPAPHRARPGTIWTLEDLDPLARDHLDMQCRSWLGDRRIRSVAAIPLGVPAPEVDLLELYCPAVPSKETRLLLEELARAAAIAWQRRERGRVARQLGATPAIANRLAAEEGARQASLLSPANPAGLTAAETRICRMIQNGSSPSEIVDQSHISESTLRSHLRSIYAKADVSGHVGLVRLLLGGGAEAGVAMRVPG